MPERLMRALLTIALLLGLAPGAIAIAEDSTSSTSPETVAAPDASDYRDAGFPQCPDATMRCAVGQIPSDEPQHFKVYSSNDPKLNGKTLILANTIDTSGWSGKDVLLQLQALAGKQVLSAVILGAAPSPAEIRTSPTPFVSSIFTSIDLSHWKVTLPLAKGHDPSCAIEVPDLAGFSLPPNFDVQPDRITFAASTEVAHTTGSH